MGASLQVSDRQANPGRDKNENLVQIDFVSLDQTPQSLMTGGLFPVYLSPVQFEKKLPWVIQSPVHREA